MRLEKSFWLLEEDRMSVSSTYGNLLNPREFPMNSHKVDPEYERQTSQLSIAKCNMKTLKSTENFQQVLANKIQANKLTVVDR